MTLLILSFAAGALTVLAPCVLPLLPVIVGGSLLSEGQSKKQFSYRPVIIAVSLAASVIIFTLLLKYATMFLSVPDAVWHIGSGLVVILLGMYFIWPQIWYQLPAVSAFSASSNKLLGKSFKEKGIVSAVLIGCSLGPVFNSCSPTYALVVAGVLPESFAKGLLYLAAYAIGLSGTLLLAAYGGKTAVAKLGWLSSPHGYVKKTVGIVFIIVGLSVVFGLDKKAQAYVLDRGWYDPIGRFEQSLDK